MRKLFLYITTGVMGALLFTACSEDTVAPNIGDGTMMSWDEAVQPSDVEILLGASAGNMQSRASIEALENGSFQTNSNDTLGIFALATGFVKENLKDTTYAPINWAGEWQADSLGKLHFRGFNERYSVYLNNTRAGVSYAHSNPYFIAGSKIGWMDTKVGKVFYPLASWHKYSFYAYNPRVDSITYSTNRITAVMRHLKGTEDVIWACVEPRSGDAYRDIAYCADYFRKSLNINNAPEVNTRMTFAFKHKMMRLTFEITAGAPDETIDDTLRNYDNAYKTKIHSISILNVPDEVQLVIADKTPITETDSVSNKQGQLTYSSSRTKTYYLKEKRKIGSKELPDSVLTPVCPAPLYPAAYKEGNRDHTNVPAITPIGEGIILPALTDNDRLGKPYKMQIVLEYPKGTFQKKVFTLDAPFASFEAGMSYNLRLKIYSPADISMSATASKWEIFDEKDLRSYVDPDKVWPEDNDSIKNDNKK